MYAIWASKPLKFGGYGTALLATSVNTPRLLVIGSLYWEAGEFLLVLPCAAISSLVMPMTLTPCGLMLPGTLLHTEGKPVEEGVGGPKIYETCSSSVAESNPHISLPAFLLAGFLRRMLGLASPRHPLPPLACLEQDATMPVDSDLYETGRSRKGMDEGIGE